MFNVNSGYVGSSRSVRSQSAINSYEVPITMINKSLIDDFLDEVKNDFTEDEFAFLKSVSVSIWKFVAKEKMTASSWHHTSSYFNKTDHYSLDSIAERIIENKDTLNEDYQEYKKDKKEEKTNFTYGVIKVQVWGGTKRHPKIIGYDTVAGIIIGDWLYYKNNHEVDGRIGKYKTTVNKVESLDEYGSYEELVKKHKDYKSTKKVFNKLIKTLKDKR